MTHPYRPMSGLGDAFPGNAGPFVTPGTSPYQKSGSAISLAGFGTAPTPAPVVERQAVPKNEDSLAAVKSAVGFASSVAGVYHGYKRHNGSILWALAWGVVGGIWPIGLPLMLAQGFGKPMEK